jgi:hypothetical protein
MTVLQSFTDAVDAIDIVNRSPVDKRIVKEKVVLVPVVVAMMMMIVVWIRVGYCSDDQ